MAAIPILCEIYTINLNNAPDTIEDKIDSTLIVCKLDTTIMQVYEKENLDKTKGMEVKLTGYENGLKLNTPFSKGQYINIYIKYDRIVDDGRMPWDQRERRYGAYGTNTGCALFEKIKLNGIDDESANILECTITYGISHKRIPGTCKYDTKMYSRTYTRGKDLEKVKFIEYWLLEK